MPREFKLPDLGEGVAEGEIVKWLVSEGNEIKEDQPMVEVMTDKATVQIPSPTTGRVKQILAKEGQTVKVGTTLVVLDPQDQKSGEVEQQKAVQKPQEGQPPRVPSPQPAAQQSRIVAPPATRRLARELDVDIDSVSGSGPGGRITDEDVRKAAQSKGNQGIAAMASFQTRQVEQVPRPSQQQLTLGREEHLPLRGIRKRIAEKMSRSKRTAAHVTHIDEVDFTELIALREKLKPMAEKHNVKLTFLPFIMKAAIAALKEFPYFNSSLDDEKQEIVLKHYYNIGFATDTPDGLIVPVVKDADKKSILQLAREIEELSPAPEKGRLPSMTFREEPSR